MAALNEPTTSAMTVGPSDSGAGLMTKLPQAVTQAVQPLVQQAGQQITGSVSSALGTGGGGAQPAITPRPGGMPSKGGIPSRREDMIAFTGGIPRGMQPNLPNIRMDQGPSNFSDPTHPNYVSTSLPAVLGGMSAANQTPSTPQPNGSSMYSASGLLQDPQLARLNDAFYAAEGGSVPAAQAVQSQGRGNDSMLVHMTPGEVRGLQALAVANGGSLTINPQTGLPEAGFLSSILPTVAGVAGSIMFPGASPWLIGAGVGGLTALATGDLGQGFMAGLGAFGGANLGSALSNAGAAASQAAADQAIMTQAATESTGSALAGELAGQQALTQAEMLAAQNAGLGLNTAADEIMRQNMAFGLTKDAAAQQLASSIPGATAANLNFGLAPSGWETAKLGLQNLGTTEGWSNLGGALSDQWAGMGTMEKAATVGGALNTAAPLLEPEPMQFATPEQREWNYLEPQAPTERKYIQPSYADIVRGGQEYTYFTPSNPVPYGKGDSVDAEKAKEEKEKEELRENMGDFARYIYDKTGTNIDLQAIKKMMQLEGKADGGTVHMEDGGFVMDARSVSEMGNGSSSAGLERLAQMGGVPIQGRGDGVSDSIPATIDGNPIAAVAREEAYFSPDAVKRIGGGSIQRGSDKLYAMMDKAIAARKKAGRGTDSGLGTLMA